MRRTRVIPVLESSSGKILFSVTARRAEKLISIGRVVRLPDGIFVKCSEQAGATAASIETIALRSIFPDNGAQLLESIGKTMQFVNSRSPYRWARRDRLTPGRK